MQPKPEPADWTKLEVPYVEPEVPQEVVDQELEELRSSVAELTPVEDRPARTGDVAVIDAFDESGDGQRDLVVELGTGRLLEELERALIGSSPGETKELELEHPPMGHHQDRGLIHQLVLRDPDGGVHLAVRPLLGVPDTSPAE